LLVVVAGIAGRADACGGAAGLAGEGSQVGGGEGDVIDEDVRGIQRRGVPAAGEEAARASLTMPLLRRNSSSSVSRSASRVTELAGSVIDGGL
jgi:hypothetical protein